MIDPGAILTSVVAGIFSAGGAWAAVRVELNFLRQEVEEVKERLTYLERNP
jgi:hypothetical protein